MKVFAFFPVFTRNTQRWVWWKEVMLCFEEAYTDWEIWEEYTYGPIRWYDEIIEEDEDDQAVS